MSARVLVTGGAGFIGSHLCEALVARGDDVVVLDDLSGAGARDVAGVRVIRASVADVAQHADALAGVTVVYHLAALISSFESLASPQKYLDVNVGGLLALLAQPERPRIVFASSSTVYGIRPEAVCSEDDLPAPATPYALSKLAGEHLLAMYAERNGLEYACLRLFNVYGPRQSPHHPYANVACKFAHAARGDRRVQMYGSGDQSRDFVYVDDVVRAFLLAAEPGAPRVCNVGTGTSTSIRDLLALVQELSGAELSVEQQPPWPNDIRAMRADTTRQLAALHLDTTVDLREGMRRTLEHASAEATRGART